MSHASAHLPAACCAYGPLLSNLEFLTQTPLDSILSHGAAAAVSEKHEPNISLT